MIIHGFVQVILTNFLLRMHDISAFPLARPWLHLCYSTLMNRFTTNTGLQEDHVGYSIRSRECMVVGSCGRLSLRQLDLFVPLSHIFFLWFSFSFSHLPPRDVQLGSHFFCSGWHPPRDKLFRTEGVFSTLSFSGRLLSPSLLRLVWLEWRGEGLGFLLPCISTPFLGLCVLNGSFGVSLVGSEDPTRSRFPSSGCRLLGSPRRRLHCGRVWLSLFQ